VTLPRVLVVQHEAGTGPGWWGDWLAATGLALEVRHPYAGEALPGPDDLGSYAALLVLGGAMGPVEDEACPWLPATRGLLAGAVDTGLPTFGICLGAELLVVACGGSVRRGTNGPELGVLTNDPTPEAADDPVLASLRPGAPVLQWHWEELAELPDGAVLLATSPAYRHQAFRLGTAAWGVQGHPGGDPGHHRRLGPRGQPPAAGRGAGAGRAGRGGRGGDPRAGRDLAAGRGGLRRRGARPSLVEWRVAVA
jgi:GMP synthase-like glutamine amidotransferase